MRLKKYEEVSTNKGAKFKFRLIGHMSPSTFSDMLTEIGFDTIMPSIWENEGDEFIRRRFLSIDLETQYLLDGLKIIPIQPEGDGADADELEPVIPECELTVAWTGLSVSPSESDPTDVLVSLDGTVRDVSERSISILSQYVQFARDLMLYHFASQTDLVDEIKKKVKEDGKLNGVDVKDVQIGASGGEESPESGDKSKAGAKVSPKRKTSGKSKKQAPKNTTDPAEVFDQPTIN